MIEVGEKDGLAVGGLDVFATAAVAVAAGADFVVEGAVYFVLFCAEDGGEVVSHGLVVWGGEGGARWGEDLGIDGCGGCRGLAESR